MAVAVALCGAARVGPSPFRANDSVGSVLLDEVSGSQRGQVISSDLGFGHYAGLDRRQLGPQPLRGRPAYRAGRLARARQATLDPHWITRRGVTMRLSMRRFSAQRISQGCRVTGWQDGRLHSADQREDA